jgi:hypothetical protein
MLHALLPDLAALLDRVIPKRDTKVRALRRLTYYERQHLLGDTFMCDAQQAAQWIRSGLVAKR